MKATSKICSALVLMSGVFFGSFGQINLLSDDIYFREYDNAARTTRHYGDLSIRGGSQGTSWGWMSCEAAIVDAWLTLYGDMNVYGSKNFTHPHPCDTTKVIKYICIESAEALTLARGTASTVSGEAVVALPEHFKLVTSTNAPLTVILTPEDAPVLLYTKEKSKEQIVIGMKDSDFYEFGDVPFAFQVTGVRDGFEDEKVIVDITEMADNHNVSDRRTNYNKRVKRTRAMVKKLKNEKKRTRSKLRNERKSTR